MKHQSPNPVHPRLRGELFACHKLSFALFGSSPLTRGTLTEFLWPRLSMRFIPAYAGNSYRVHHAQKMRSVHPRLRGELATDTVSVTGGSSPLTRGTQQETFGARQRPRFIPAYAGNSKLAREFFNTCSVHPRLRGELLLMLACNVLNTGSSPLTRGTQILIEFGQRIKRFIPAYAGNSCLISTGPLWPTVHPRLRGEL